MDYWKKFQKIVYKDIIEHKVNEKSIGEKGSFKELLFGVGFSEQSVSIKMGHVQERSFSTFIKNIDGVELDQRMILNHQIDLLFDYKGKKYYFESKNNMNLDTKKSAKEKEVLISVKKFLIEEVGNENLVEAKFLNSRYDTTENISFFTRPIEKKDVIGYSDFFKIFDIDISREQWETFYLEVGRFLINKG